MARGVNKVIIIGNLGDDPTTKYMPSGNAVTNITVATSESWKDKQTGEQKEKTEWHRVCFFNRLAEVAGEYLRKGSKVYLEGSLRTRKWQDQSGQDRYTTEIIASEMQMLDGKGDNPQPQQQPKKLNQQATQQPPATFGNQPQHQQSQQFQQAQHIPQQNQDPRLGGGVQQREHPGVNDLEDEQIPF